MLYGYRTSEVVHFLGDLPLQRPKSVINARDMVCDERRVMQVSLGPTVRGIVLPYPDIYDVESAIDGARKRIVPDVHSVNPRVLRGFRDFVRCWIQSNLDPLPIDEDISFETWLAKTNYNEARKVELRRIWDNCNGLVKAKDYDCKSFIKAENYTDYKYPRCINSRSDVFKCFTGPIFKAIENRVYENPYFIKHIPVDQRASYIYRMAQEGATYVATDHSSFEARISQSVMRVCELALYSYMTRNLPNHQQFMDHVYPALSGVQHCHFKRFDVETTGCRMSGDMCTSLGNGFTNLMVMLYLSSTHGETPMGVVEGDDGLFVFLDTASVPTVEEFQSLGFDIKLEKFASIGKAGFCGMYFDENLLSNVANPVELLVKFGWTDSQSKAGSQKVLNQLLVAKAYSLLYELPCCPIARELALWVLRCLPNTSPIWEKTPHTMFSYRQARALSANNKDVYHLCVPLGNRLLVEELFGLSVSEQHAIESWIASQKTLCEIPFEMLATHVPSSWVHASRLVSVVPRRCI